VESLDVLARLAAAYDIRFDAALLPASHRFRTPDGLELHYLDWPGRGDTLVLLHGGALTAHTWDLVALALEGEHRVVALDLRGHGLSDWSERYSIPDSVRDVEALVTELGVERVHLAGMSLGGNVAAHYAASPRTRALSLTLVDVGPWVDFRATQGMREFMSQPIAELSLDELVDRACAVSTSGGGRDKILYRYVHMTHRLPDGSLAWRNDRRRPHDYAHILAKLEELPELAKSMALPVRIVRGGRSRVLTDEKVARFAACFPNGSWVLIPEAGHNVQEDAPKALASELREFLRAT
jgi:pimeloyl-ACP methyl ester carboxylesterase